MDLPSVGTSTIDNERTASSTELEYWGFLYKPSKRGILEINEAGLGLAAERSHRDRSSQKTS